jgi:hypothetical protein
MFKKLIRELGFVLISNSLLFTPMIAAADDGSTTGAVVGFPAGALITGVFLVSMSRTKNKATKAKDYVKGKLTLHEKHDEYIKTEKKID